MKSIVILLSTLLSLSLSAAESSNVESAAEGQGLRAAYGRAQEIHKYEENQWFLNDVVFPHWIGNSNRFWFKEATESGHQFTIVDPADERSSPLFNHRRLADRLGDATNKEVDADELPIYALSVDLAASELTFESLGKKWTYNSRRNNLKEIGPLGAPGSTAEIVSPDGLTALFRRDHNLWVRDVNSGDETQLTTDGEEFYSYATLAQATGRAETELAAIWSPDSKKILTHQTDDRQVKDLPMVNFAPKEGMVRPTAFSYRTALPGDEHVTSYRITVIDLATGKKTAALYQPLLSARMLDTPVTGNRAWWSADSKRAYFVDIERFEKAVHVVEFSADSGRARKLFSESRDDGYVELGSTVYMAAVLRPLPETNELVWYSERSGWGHLYLYDLESGELVRPLTKGDWLVRDVIGVDEGRREVFFSRGEHNSKIDPYYREIARVNLDTGEVKQLSGSDADHFVVNQSDISVLIASFVEGLATDGVSGLSPTGDYYVESTQRIDQLPKTVVRDRGGKLVMTVVEPDASRIPDWYQMGEPVQVLAADGVTPISAVLFKPSNLTPGKKYPIIDHIYGGPQVSHVPELPSNHSAIRSSALSELGFVGVIIDGRGTPERSTKFHESSYGAAHTASNLEDHIAAIKQLAERYPYIDDTRVGIFGFSGGGYMTANAMVRFPEFFDVGVAGAGNHDQRLFWSTWGERYHGEADGDNYLSQATSTHADKLQGDLLFMHGMMDFGVHPAALFQLMQALIDANKDFDLILLPQAGHTSNGWAERRLWEYFLENLAGSEVLPGFKLDSVFETQAAQGEKLMAQRYGISAPPEPGSELSSDEEAGK